MDRFLNRIRSEVRAHPGRVALVVVLLTAVFGGLAMQAETATGTNNFAPDNEAFRASMTIDEEFETDSTVTAQVAIVADGAGDVLSAAGLAAVERLEQAILSEERIAPALVGSPDGQVIVSFFTPIQHAATEQGVDLRSMDDVALDAFAADVIENLSPEDGTVTGLLGGEVNGTDATAGMMLVFLDGSDVVTDEVRDDALMAFAAVRHLAPGFDVHPLNEVLLFEEVNDEIQGQLGSLLGIAFLLIIGILVAIYRRASDVISSLLGLVFAIVWMQGISVLLGPGFLGWIGGPSEMSTMIPILLVGLGVDYGIHLTMRYREQRTRGDEPGAAAGGAITAVGTALILATVTTVVGFLTNVTNPLPPLRDFGVSAAVGVTSAFLIMTSFVPAIRLLLDRRAERRGTLKPIKVRADGKPSSLGHLSSLFAPLAVRHPVRVLSVAGVLTVAGAFGASQLSTEFGQTDFFPEESAAVATMNAFTDNFGGDLAETTSILVEGDVDTVAAWDALADLHVALADSRGVRVVGGQAQATSLLSIAMTAGLADAPLASGEAVSELYGQLVESVPGAAAFVSPSAGGGWDALVVKVATQAADQVAPLQADLAADVAALEAAGLKVTVTSNGILNDAVLTELRDSQLTSLVLTLVASMAILALAFWVRNRRPMLGVLSIATVGMVVFWVFGIMAATGIPFNVMTAMISALAIGIGVPFGIHVVNRYLEDHQREPDVERAMTSTLEHTGGALMGSALTTVAGFGVLVVATVKPMQQFGLVTALTIGLAMLSAILVLPAMLALWSRREDQRIVRDRRSDEQPADDATGAKELVASN